MNAGFIIAKYIKVPNPLHILSYKKRAVSSALFSYYSIGNIDNATRPFFVSISSTHTLTICPTDTTSNGCFTYCLLSLEICTKPSCFTPTSTKAPNQQRYELFLPVPYHVLNLLISKSLFSEVV